MASWGWERCSVVLLLLGTNESPYSPSGLLWHSPSWKRCLIPPWWPGSPDSSYGLHWHNGGGRGGRGYLLLIRDEHPCFLMVFSDNNPVGIRYWALHFTWWEWKFRPPTWPLLSCVDGGLQCLTAVERLSVQKLSVFLGSPFPASFVREGSFPWESYWHFWLTSFNS